MGGLTVKREVYEELKVELIRFESADVITESPAGGPEEDEIGKGPIK